MEYRQNSAPKTYTYQLARFSLGNATSLAPIISGSRKLPSAAGIDGMMNKKIMIAPWRVKNWLYVSASIRIRSGLNNSVRRTTASAPPTKKKNMIAVRYMMPIRL